MNLSLKDFYFYGMILLIIGVSGTIFNLVWFWPISTIAGKISTIFGTVLFQGLIILLFYSLWRQQAKIDTGDFAEQIENFKKKNKSFPTIKNKA